MPLMHIFVVIFFVLAYPISLLLTKILGEEAADMYSKARMKKLFDMYEEEKLLNPSEKRILTAALEISEKRAVEIMTPLD